MTNDQSYGGINVTAMNDGDDNNGLVIAAVTILNTLLCYINVNNRMTPMT